MPLSMYMSCEKAFIYIYLFFSFLILSSCQPSASQSGILTNQKVCSLEECPNPPEKIQGQLSIESDSSNYQMNVDQGDSVEISGKCSDLNLRDNRILVQAFEGEDTSINPYLDNSISVNCDGNSTVPTINGNKCIWINKGRGVTDSGTEYPQCHNGRFSFSVKLGRILRTVENTTASATSNDATNPRKKYLIRFKLRAIDGSSVETPWSQALVDRGLSKPEFSLDPTNFLSRDCKIRTNAFRNILSFSDIYYTATLVREYNNNQIDPLFPSHVIFPYSAFDMVLDYNAASGFSLLDFQITNRPTVANVIKTVIPGVKHKIALEAFDNKYDYTNFRFGGADDRSGLSEYKLCTDQRAILNVITGEDRGPTAGEVGPPAVPPSNCVDTLAYNSSAERSGSLKSCNLTVDFQDVNIGEGSIEWMAIKGKSDWEGDFEPAAPIGNFSGANQGTSNANMINVAFLGNTKNFIFRPGQYTSNTCSGTGVSINNNYNGIYGVAARYVSPSGRKGLWSQVKECIWSN